MANVNATNVVQEASKILASNNVVVERLGIFNVMECLGIFYDRLEMVCLKMEYHQCKVDFGDNQLEKPQVDKDVTCQRNFSQVDGLKELVPTIVKNINLKALFLCYRLVYGLDVNELLLQGLYMNHTIVMVNFVVTMHLVPDLVEKLVVMFYRIQPSNVSN
jgi:hypothetical protein